MNRAATIVMAAVLWGVLLASSMAQGITIEALPPSVIKTVPACGDTQVDPNLKEISVTFSKDMLPQAWSFVRMSPESFPTIIGNPKYLNDKRTCVVNVTLEPSTTYVIWLNSGKFQNFKDTNEKPAVPYLLVFRTSTKK